MRFEAIDVLYSLDNSQRRLDSSEAKLGHFEGQNTFFCAKLTSYSKFSFCLFEGAFEFCLSFDLCGES